MENIAFYKIYPKKTIKRINSKVELLGVNSNVKTFTFLNIRILLCFILFIMLLFTKYGYLLSPIVSVLIYFLIEKLVFDYKIKKRGKKLEKEAIFFFEIFTLTLESGRNITKALELTTNNITSEISLEFKKTLNEVKLGKSLNEALEAMKKRIPSDEVNNMILNIIESNTYGNSLIDSMYNGLQFLRDKEILDIKGEINKLPTKVSIISVLFFIPIIIFIILAPIIIEYIGG